MNEHLILDCAGDARLYLTEGHTAGPVRFQGKFQAYNETNKNRRLYPENVLRTNVDRLMETLNARGLVGELDHPTDSVVHFENASHLITKLWWEGKTLMGEAEVLPTPSGCILKGLLESGVRIGISSRGVGNGSPNQDGVLVIGESYKLITFDAVADPSTFAAYQKVAKNEEFIKKVQESSINKVDSNALISYLGHLVEARKSKIIQEKFNYERE